MFIEFINPKVIDVYATADRLKIRIDETGRVTPITANLAFEKQDDLLMFVTTLLDQYRKVFPTGKQLQLEAQEGQFLKSAKP